MKIYKKRRGETVKCKGGKKGKGGTESHIREEKNKSKSANINVIV